MVGFSGNRDLQGTGSCPECFLVVGRAASGWKLLPSAEGELSANFQLDAELMGAPGRGRKAKTAGERARRTKELFCSAQPWGPRTASMSQM